MDSTLIVQILFALLVVAVFMLPDFNMRDIGKETPSKPEKSTKGKTKEKLQAKKKVKFTRIDSKTVKVNFKKKWWQKIKLFNK
jgi:hypothetical protein